MQNDGTLRVNQNALNRNNKIPPKCTSLNLYQSAVEATAAAEQICMVEGPYSERCKAAWGIVEEFRAADSHDRVAPAEPYDLDYTPLVNGLDILTEKIDRKMDELSKVATQLGEAGAGVPEVERLVYASEEFKQILAEARSAMDVYR